MNVIPTFLFYVLLSLTYQEFEARKKLRNRRVINHVFFEDCDPGRYPNLVNNTKLLYNGHIKTVDADIHFAHSYRRLMATFTAHKCTAMRDKICEPVITGKLDMCKVFTDKGQFYSYGFENCWHPKIKCPVKKGLYRFRNASLSADHFLAMVPLSFEELFVYYWNIKLHLYEPSKPKEIVICGLNRYPLEDCGKIIFFYVVYWGWRPIGYQKIRAKTNADTQALTDPISKKSIDTYQNLVHDLETV